MLKNKDIDLSALGFLDQSYEKCLFQGRNFILNCYNQSKVTTLNDARRKAWKHCITKNKSNAPKLETLTPTDKAFLENLKRGNLQIVVWRCSLSAVTPVVDIFLHGWGKEGQT